MNSDESDKIVVKKRQFDPFVYIHTILEYAKFDLSYQKKLTEKRTIVPLTQEEQEYFYSIIQHLHKAQGVLEELRIVHEDLKEQSLWYRIKKLWPF